MTGVTMSATKVCGGSRSVGGFCRGEFRNKEEEEKRRHQQMSMLELLLTVLRKTLAYCRRWNRRNEDEVEDDERGFEIGWPTNVRHVAHVTFDRFEGFLGLPVEFEEEVEPKAPSARFVDFQIFMHNVWFSGKFNSWIVKIVSDLILELIW